MALPTDVKHALVERFMPLLYLSREEPDYPVDPTAYIESAALWSSEPPRHEKLRWGAPAGSDRRPIVERGGISLNPAHDVHGTSDPDGDGVPEHYLGQEDDGTFPFLTPDDREPWLDVAGWQDGEHVSPATLNRRTEPGPRPPLEQPWFSADVWTVEDLAEQLGSEGMEARFGLGGHDQAPALEGAVVVAFHFLFPLHRERRRTTALDPADDPYTGEYEGDWATFAVIARSTGPAPSQVSSPDEVTPAYAAYGRRWRGVDADHEDGATERMFLRPWADVLAVDDHPVVVAAPGTHNLYPHDPPVTPAGTVKPQFIEWGKSTSEPANAMVRDPTEEPYAAVLALKIMAGAAFGPVGLVVGILAATEEASWAEEEGLMEPPKFQANPPPESDNPLADDWEDLQTKSIAVPPGIGAPPLADPAQSEVREWQVPVDRSLVDGSILFEPQPDGRPAYGGRWGVRCTADPFLRRSGMRFPAHRPLVIDALLTQT